MEFHASEFATVFKPFNKDLFFLSEGQYESDFA